MRRILMVNLPYAGHTNPTLPLAAELARRGHDVGYINAPAWRDRIEPTGARFIPYADYPAGLSAQQTKMRCLRAAYDTVVREAAAYDVLLYEMLFFPGMEVARRLGLVPVRQLSQPAWNPETVRAMGSLPRVAACKLIEWQMFSRATARHMRMAGKTLMRSVIDDIPDLNIVYVPEALQPCRETFDGRFLFTGPTVPWQPPAVPSFDFDTLPRPIVYISMGSIISSKGFCRRCVRAFGERPGTYFLSTGRVAPEALGTLPANLIARSFLPQLEILAHADLFITHGGMNSVNEAIHFGVPMLVLPVLNDQPMNARQIERNGIGRKLRAFPLGAGTLARHAESVLADTAIRENVRAMGHAARRSGGIQAAADRVEALSG